MWGNMSHKEINEKIGAKLNKEISVKNKLIDIEKLSNKELNIDGYNVLIGIEALLKNNVVLCDDGIYRDFMGIYGNYKINSDTERALNLLMGLFKKYDIKPIFYFDAQVSKSGELSKKIRNLMEKYNIDGKVFCVSYQRLKSLACPSNSLNNKGGGH